MSAQLEEAQTTALRIKLECADAIIQEKARKEPAAQKGKATKSANNTVLVRSFKQKMQAQKSTYEETIRKLRNRIAKLEHELLSSNARR